MSPLMPHGPDSLPPPPEGRSDMGWTNLPPHLQQALTEALEGLREAYLDVNHPLIPQLQALWAVTDEIERELLSRERE